MVKYIYLPRVSPKCRPKFFKLRYKIRLVTRSYLRTHTYRINQKKVIQLMEGIIEYGHDRPFDLREPREKNKQVELMPEVKFTCPLQLSLSEAHNTLICFAE